MELTLETGLAGSIFKLKINWFDENNVRHQNELVIAVDEIDKPRTVVIGLDKTVLANITNQGTVLR